MIPEIGQFALSLALLVALVQGVLPLYGSLRNIPTWVALARPAAHAQLLLVAVAYGCLTYASVVSDFSVAYVANNSNSQLPLLFRFAGVWGGHEGSLLLWSLILALWSAAVARFTRAMPPLVVARTLAIMGLVSVGFLLFMLLTSNPFDRIFPAPLEGRDLNPLLQDVALAVHPPMLYTGYAGFSVAFAFALAALIGGRLDAAWARWSRPWTNLAWMFLTIGITLGSWWAYYELGWGGWWFWDPVENASFMPWLAGTALIHSLAATEKRGAFKAWSALLAITAFSLSLLGTFLVRSGVLTSVHAFANDPARGLFILIFIGGVSGASLLLFALRAPRVISAVRFTMLSREMAILLNSLFLGVLCFAVLTGTLYPLILESISGARISVGPPYFDFLFGVLGVPLALCMGAGVLLRWREDRAHRVGRPLAWAAVLSAAVGGLAPLIMPRYSVSAALGISMGVWIVLTTLMSLGVHMGSLRGPGVAARLRRAGARIPTAAYGMALAHLGVAMFVIGVASTRAYDIEKDIAMAPGEQHSLSGYDFRFDGVSDHLGANYTAVRGAFHITREGRPVAALYPEKRTYLVQRNPMTEAAIAPGFTRDLYVALGEPLNEDGTWAVRIYYKPLVRWIWFGALLMAAGGLLAATDRRYRMPVRAAQAAAAPPPTHAHTPLPGTPAEA